MARIIGGSNQNNQPMRRPSRSIWQEWENAGRDADISEKRTKLTPVTDEYGNVVYDEDGNVQYRELEAVRSKYDDAYERLINNALDSSKRKITDKRIKAAVIGGGLVAGTAMGMRKRDMLAVGLMAFAAYKIYTHDTKKEQREINQNTEKLNKERQNLEKMAQIQQNEERIADILNVPAPGATNGSYSVRDVAAAVNNVAALTAKETFEQLSDEDKAQLSEYMTAEAEHRANYERTFADKGNCRMEECHYYDFDGKELYPFKDPEKESPEIDPADYASIRNDHYSKNINKMLVSRDKFSDTICCMEKESAETIKEMSDMDRANACPSALSVEEKKHFAEDMHNSVKAAAIVSENRTDYINSKDHDKAYTHGDSMLKSLGARIPSADELNDRNDEIFRV